VDPLTDLLTSADRLPVLPSLPADGRLHRDEHRGHLEALIPTPRRSNHAPSLAVLPSGALVAAWFGGSDEGNQDVDILVARLDPATGRWSEGVAVTHDPERSDQNPGLFLAAEDELWLLYTSQASRQSGLEETFNLQHTAVVRRLVSRDGGESWEGPETVFDQAGTFARQPIQRLAGGRLVHAQWLCHDDDTLNGSDQPVLQLSEDDGASWRRVEVPEAAGRVHPNAVELAPGRLVALFRDRFAEAVQISRSEDGGESWSAPVATELPNNNAGLSALRLPSGRLAVVSNEENDPREGAVHWPYERTRMSIAVSEDEGRSFPVRRIVEPGDGFSGRGNRRSNRRQEYPHAVLDAGGRLHVLYAHDSRVAIKHVVLEEGWIDGTPDQAHPDAKLWS